MKSSLKVAVRASIFEVLETMFFLPVKIFECNCLEDALPDGTMDVNKCRLDFTGNYSGRFILYIPDMMLRKLVINFLGMDKDIQSEQMKGMIEEITNMIAGNTLGRWDNQCAYDLQIPRIVEMNDDLSDKDDTVLYGVRSDDGLMAVQITINQPT